MGVRGIDKRTDENKQTLETQNEKFKNDKLAWIIINGVKSGYIVSSHGIVYNSNLDHEFKFIKPHLTKDGHLRLGMQFKGNKIKKYIHVLVAEAFVPNPDNKPFVHHIDGDSLNNEYTNLMWVTRLEHEKLTSELNQYQGLKGSENPSSKYTDEQISHALQLMQENELFPDEICEITGITYSVFQHLRFRDNSWSYLKKNYDISNYNKFRRAEYSAEQKYEFINLRRSTPEVSLKGIAKIMKIPYSTAKSWNKVYKYQIEA